MEHHPNNKLHSKIKYYVLNYYWLARNGSLILFPIPPAFVSPPFPSSFSPSLPPPFTKPALAGRAGFLFERYGSNDNNGNKYNNNNNIKQ